MKRIICVMMMLLLCICTFSSVAYGADISTPYQYPIVPGTPEWEKLQSLDEMIRVCQIPNDILENMSTDELVATVVDYPLAINILAYETPKKAIEVMRGYFNGLQELCARSSAVYSVESYLDKMEAEKSISPIKQIFANTIYQLLAVESREEIEVPLRYETHSNYTPNGSRVYFTYNLTWADHNMNAALGNTYNEEYKLIYPNAIPIREENPAYNCHSYAWYSTSSSNKYWLDGSYASYYMSDGSYSRTYSPTSGDKVWYGSADHSAIYYGNSMVTSKWGFLGLYRHNLSYCPYPVTNISYWE